MLSMLFFGDLPHQQAVLPSAPQHETVLKDDASKLDLSKLVDQHVMAACR